MKKRCNAWAMSAALLAIAATPIQATAINVAQAPAFPMAGTTCAYFGTRQESEFHFYRGTAPTSLDPNGDGIPCENLPTTFRRDGNRIASNFFTTGYSYALWRVNTHHYYLAVSYRNELLFTTRSFRAGQDAINHARCYFGRELSYCNR